VCGGLICEMLEAGEGRVVMMMRYYYQSLKRRGGNSVRIENQGPRGHENM